MVKHGTYSDNVVDFISVSRAPIVRDYYEVTNWLAKDDEEVSVDYGLVQVKIVLTIVDLKEVN